MHADFDEFRHTSTGNNVEKKTAAVQWNNNNNNNINTWCTGTANLALSPIAATWRI